MSVLDDFRDAEQRVVQRLKELEPALAEYRELEAVAQRLGIDPATATSTAGSVVASPRGRRRGARATPKGAGARDTAASRAKPAPRRPPRGGPGQRTQELLELVRARPGITVSEAGKALGVDPTGLYRVVRRLEDSGELRKQGRKLEPTATAG